jgi:hypothetical protein
VFDEHDEHVVHPLHDVHAGPPCPEHWSLLHASPSAWNAEAHAWNGPRHPFTWTSMFVVELPASTGSFCPERHRLSDRTHVSFPRKASAPDRPATVFTLDGGGVHPSASTHWATVSMLASARTQSSSTLCWLPPSFTRNAHSLWLLEKSVSDAFESQAPPLRHVSQRAVTSATQDASVGYVAKGLPRRDSGVSVMGGAMGTPRSTGRGLPASRGSSADIATSHDALT